MSDDLVKRLRFLALEISGPKPVLETEAADRIEELEAGRDALAEELEREKQHAEEWMLGARAMEQKLSLMAARISALDAALAKADELAGAVQGLNGSLWQTTIPNALTAYRQARDATT